MITCPVCGKKGIGKVGANQYYCWDCCVEFVMRDQDVKVFNVEMDGTLTSHDDDSPEKNIEDNEDIAADKLEAKKW